jgi:DNA-binding NtrC family response regulator
MNKTVLLIDDDRLRCQQSAQQIRAAELRCSIASSIRIAWQLLLRQVGHYDVVAMDESVWRRGGRQLLQRMHCTEGLAKIPTIIMREKTAQQYQLSWQGQNVLDFIYKPLHHKLFAVIVAEITVPARHIKH